MLKQDLLRQIVQILQETSLIWRRASTLAIGPKRVMSIPDVSHCKSLFDKRFPSRFPCVNLFIVIFNIPDVHWLLNTGSVLSGKRPSTKRCQLQMLHTMTCLISLSVRQTYTYFLWWFIISTLHPRIENPRIFIILNSKSGYFCCG